MDAAQWLPPEETHEPPGEGAAGFDLAVQARLRRERAGRAPSLALGAAPMSVGARRLWSSGFLLAGLTLLGVAAGNLLGGFAMAWCVVLTLGLAVTLIAGHRFLASFNPTLSLLAERATFAPGDAVEVRWAFSRPIRAATGLKVMLRGEERATYRQGTSDTTARETFFEETVHEVDAGPAGVPAGGVFTVRVPDDAMHSFVGDNNAIEWTLRAVAPLPRWPDVGRTVILRVWCGPEPAPAQEEAA